MYRFKGRVRYSETDEASRLSIAAVINYMQDCSTFQSEDIHAGIQELFHRRRVWMLSGWQILIDRYPELGEEIEVSTWHCGSRGIYGYRNFMIRDSLGREAVRAASRWFMYDIEKNCPTRVLPEDTSCYGAPEPALDLGAEMKKIAIPGDYEEKTGILVGHCHLDTNHHVNNARYIELAAESLPEGLRVKAVRADYKRGARLGEWMIPRVTRQEEDSWTVVLGDEKGDVYAAVWLQTEKERQG